MRCVWCVYLTDVRESETTNSVCTKKDFHVSYGLTEGHTRGLWGSENKRGWMRVRFVKILIIIEDSTNRSSISEGTWKRNGLIRRDQRTGF